MKTKSTKINSQLEAFKALNEQIKTLEKQKEGIKKEIKALMETKGTNVIHGLNCVATLAPVQRQGIDQSKVKELLGEKFPLCLKFTDYKAFKVVGV